MDSVPALHPAATGLIPGIPKKKFEKKLSMLPRLIDGAAALRSGQQRLNNVDQTHLVLWIVASWYYKKYVALGRPGSSGF